MTTAMKTKYPQNWMFSEQKRGCLHALRTLHAPHVRFSLSIHFFDVPLGIKNREFNSTEVVQPWQWQRQRYESMLWLDEWWENNRGTRAALLWVQFFLWILSNDEVKVSSHIWGSDAAVNLSFSASTWKSFEPSTPKVHFAYFAQRNQYEVVVKYLAGRNVLFGVMFSL